MTEHLTPKGRGPVPIRSDGYFTTWPPIQPRRVLPRLAKIVVLVLVGLASFILGHLLTGCASRNETFELERFRPAITERLNR